LIDHEKLPVLNRKALTTFLVLAFGLAWTLFLVPLAFGAPGSTTHQTASLVCWSLAMWAPGVAAILASRQSAGGSVAALHLRRLGERKAYLWAWLLPPVLAVIAGLFTWLFQLGKLDLSFPLIRAAMANAPGGESVSPALVVGIQAAVALTVGPLINALLGLGEELGWRGFLLPQLLGLGQMRAMLISGLVWGIWHAPVILQGHNYPNDPLLGMLFMCIFCVLIGIIFSWLYLRTQSPWAPALAHGSLNASAGLPLLFLMGVNLTFGGTLASLVGWIPIALFVGWLVWSRRLPVQIEAATPPSGEQTSTITES